LASGKELKQIDEVHMMKKMHCIYELLQISKYQVQLYTEKTKFSLEFSQAKRTST